MKSHPSTLLPIAKESAQNSTTLMVDAVYGTVRNFTGKILTGYESTELHTWPDIIERLSLANASLKDTHHLQFLIKDAYRPIIASEEMNDWAREQGKFDYFVPRYIGLPGKSQHNNASAVDLTFATLDGAEVWMGSYFDEFNEHAHHAGGRDITDNDHEWAISNTYHVHEYTIRELRELLKSVMADIDLLPYDEEWWHYFDLSLVNTAS